MSLISLPHAHFLAKNPCYFLASYTKTNIVDFNNFYKLLLIPNSVCKVTFLCLCKEKVIQQIKLFALSLEIRTLCVNWFMMVRSGLINWQKFMFHINLTCGVFHSHQGVNIVSGLFGLDNTRIWTGERETWEVAVMIIRRLECDRFLILNGGQKQNQMVEWQSRYEKKGEMKP